MENEAAACLSKHCSYEASDSAEFYDISELRMSRFEISEPTSCEPSDSSSEASIQSMYDENWAGVNCDAVDPDQMFDLCGNDSRRNSVCRRSQVTDFENIYMDDWILSSCDKACVSSDLPTSELNVDLLERHTTGPLTMASDPAPEANLPPRMTRRSVVKVRFGDNVTKSAVEHEQAEIAPSRPKACSSTVLEPREAFRERGCGGPIGPRPEPLWVSTHRGETRDVDVVLEWIYNAVAVWPQATSLETSGQVLVGFVVGVLLCHGVFEMSDFSASVSCDCFMGLSSSERVFAFSLFFISVVAALLKAPHRQDSCVVLCVGRQDTFRG